jgi:hypothetical protein
VKTATLLILLAIALPFPASAGNQPNKNDQGHPTTRADAVDRCSTLQSQYTDVIGGYQDHPHYGKASKLHSEGVSACDANETVEGSRKLEAALRELGVKPAE